MKWLIRLIGVLILMVLIAVVGLFMLPADRIAKVASDQLSRATGRTVQISGDVGVTFWPVLGVRAEGVEVGNADWAKEGAMFTTATAAIGVDAMALIRGDIRITHVEAQSPTVRLESRKDGSANWVFTDGAGTAEVESETPQGASPRSVTVEKLVITDATLIYDAEGADLVSYTGVDLSLDWADPGGAARIKAALRPASQVVSVDATIGRFAAFLVGDVQPVEVEMATDGGTVTLEGRAALDGSIAGKAALTLNNTAQFTAGLGLGAVVLPKGLGQSAQVGADVTLTPDRNLALRDLTADLGGNILRGGADIALNGIPQVNAQLNAGALDLRALTGSDAGGATQSAGSGWPKDVIDASGLGAFDGAISLRADSLNLGTLSLGATRTLLRNDRSRMVFELREVSAYGGAFTGEFVMNNRNGLSVGGKLRAAGVEMKPLLTDLAGLTRFTGTSDAEISFLGVGNTVDEIMRSLSGQGALRVGRGSIEGIDLDDLLGSFDVQGGTTVFDALTATFAISDGVLRNDDLAMLLPNFETTGAGQVDLGAQTLDYTVTPKALRVNKDRGLAVPVRIVGPWADPSIRPDVKAALDLNFQEEKDRAEQKVKEKVEEKLAEELGVVRADGQSVEDAVKDKVEDKLKRELLRIFD